MLPNVPDISSLPPISEHVTLLLDLCSQHCLSVCLKTTSVVAAKCRLRTTNSQESMQRALKVKAISYQ